MPESAATSPENRWKSDPQIPTASGRTTTFPARAGPGAGTSSITISPGDLVTAASTHGPSLSAALTSVNTGETGHYRTLMRRFPRPIPPDNDSAPKNARAIPEPGHKRRAGRRGAGVGGTGGAGGAGEGMR